MVWSDWWRVRVRRGQWGGSDGRLTLNWRRRAIGKTATRSATSAGPNAGDAAGGRNPAAPLIQGAAAAATAGTAAANYASAAQTESWINKCIE